MRLRPRSWFLLMASLAMLAMSALDLVNGRFWSNDLRVYLESGGRLMRGEAVYGVASGLSSGYFKYSPLAALFFAPLSWIPHTLAAAFLAITTIACALLGLLRAETLLRTSVLSPMPAFRAAALWWTFLVVAVHLQRELHMGNVNMVLLFLLLLSLSALLEGRQRTSGILLGTALLFKPHFIVLLPLLAIRGKHSALIFAFAACVIGLLLPALFVGWKGNLGLLHDWYRAMASHNASLFYLGGDDKEPMNTIYTVLHRISRGTIPATRVAALTIIGSIAVMILLFDRWLAQRDQGDAPAMDRDLVFEALLLIALVPSLTVTDTEHFLFAMPMVMFLVFQIMRAHRPVWLLPAGIIVLWLFGGNWGDALGGFSDVLLDHSVLGIANLLLVACCAILYVRERKTPAPV